VKLPVYQIDAFASQVFAGNPAVVCRLEDWLEDAALTAIAAEHNISTTAFLVERGEEFEIRYFAGIGELGLVGHASLAAAHVILRLLRPEASQAVLRRRDGLLRVLRLEDGLLAMELPAAIAAPCPAPAGLAATIGAPFIEVRQTPAQYFAILENEAEVAALAPDMAGVMALERDGLVVTARGGRSDFVSRAFAPKEGLPEDPVCGSAHLALVPYWAERLGRREHLALQLSPRGGELHCRLDGGEVRLAGHCALYMEGVIHI
jgi:PhzF family phenazine biosynthesis protein